MAVQWYYKMAGKEIGPFTSQELKQLADEKRITPNDPVRRDTDKDWTLAKNVKGLFPAASAIPMGVAVPVPPKDPPMAVPPVKDPPVVVPTAKKIPTPPLPKTVQPKKEEPEEETFDFGFDSSVSHGAKTGKAAAVKRPAAKGGAKAAHKKGAADEGEETEKKPLTKKEIQKRNFMIIAGATGGVIVLAILILIIMSFKSSSKPEVAQDDSAAAEEVLSEETDGTSADDEKPDDETRSEEKDGDEISDEDVKAAEESGIPAEYAEEGYKTPYVDGKWQSCTFGSAKVFIRKIKNAKLSDMNPNTRSPKKDAEYCFIKIEVENVNSEGILLDVPGWGAKGAAGVKLFAGKNQYKTQRFEVPGQADKDMQVDVGEKFTDVLIFNTPKLESVEALQLELPPLAQGDSPCKLYLPKEMFRKKAAPADGEDAEEAASGDGEEKPEADGEGAKDAENADGDSKDGGKEPSALDDDSLSDKPAPQKPEASAKEKDELDRSSEENIDILNDPSLDF
ncbi:MAG: DUF4339 domain-containing protein [Thermoguttaceae bacterium]|nr:DUF4339 domain-containing protein [Thermoguttaceae bacterium]